MSSSMSTRTGTGPESRPASRRSCWPSWSISWAACGCGACCATTAARSTSKVRDPPDPNAGTTGDRRRDVRADETFRVEREDLQRRRRWQPGGLVRFPAFADHPDDRPQRAVLGAGDHGRRRQGVHDQPAVADRQRRDRDDLPLGLGRIRDDQLRGSEPRLRSW